MSCGSLRWQAHVEVAALVLHLPVFRRREAASPFFLCEQGAEVASSTFVRAHSATTCEVLHLRQVGGAQGEPSGVALAKRALPASVSAMKKCQGCELTEEGA